jgi:hypothetical protein
MEITEKYTSLRNMVLTLNKIKPDRLAPTKEGIYAVIMESGYPNYIYTLVAVSDGAASLYYSNGGGVIGAGNYPSVRGEVINFLEMAAKNQLKFNKCNDFPFPKTNYTRFYVVTNNETYTTEILENDLVYNKSDLILFIELFLHAFLGIKGFYDL